MRLEFSRKTKAEAFLRSEGCCEVCHVKIVSGAQYDHIVPDQLGGKAVLSNCQVLCPKCHRIKTSTRDVPMIAKAKRIEAKRNNTWPKSRRPLRSRGFDRPRIEMDPDT